MNVLQKIAVFTTLVVGFFAWGAALPVSAASPFDASKQAACQGVELRDSGGCAGVETKGNRLTVLLRTLVNILSFVVGAAAVIMIIFAGLKYVTSNGEASNISSAKTSLIYAIVGLVVVAVSQLLVKYVLTTVR